MNDCVYYDGTKLLSMLDINNNKPEIYLCTTNRSGGKTTYFSRLCVNRFKDKGEKFAILIGSTMNLMIVQISSLRISIPYSLRKI